MGSESTASIISRNHFRSFSIIKQTSKYSNFWLIFGQHTSEKYFVEFEIDPQQDVSLVAAKICKKALREAKVFSKIDANANKSFVLLNLRAINGRMTERYVAVVITELDLKSYSEDEYKQRREQALTDIPIEFHA